VHKNEHVRTVCACAHCPIDYRYRELLALLPWRWRCGPCSPNLLRGSDELAVEYVLSGRRPVRWGGLKALRGQTDVCRCEQSRRPTKSLSQSPAWPNYQQQGTAFKPHNGHSALAAGTTLHAPLRPLPGATRGVSVTWEAVIRSPPLVGRGVPTKDIPFGETIRANAPAPESQMGHSSGVQS
jgi:hypothetical protein